MTARALPGADLCVHCGFCTQACPTYLALDDENDSPRGRIVLMKALATGRVAAADEAALLTHLDQCLGCRACETACPSGVPYGELLETVRADALPRRPLPFVSRLVLFTFARPVLLRLAMAAARTARATGLSRLLARAPGRVGIAMANLEATRRPVPRRGASAGSGAAPAGRATVAVLTGCVMEGLLAPVNRATERVLVRNGYRLADAPGQRCCGALHSHAGDADTARALARTNVAAFEAGGATFVAVNSAGCGAAMKAYGHLLADDPAWRERAARMADRVRDVSELLAEAGPLPAPAATRAPVAVDHPCHLLHAQRLTGPPAALLGAVTGLRATELPDAAACCGSAGLYSLAQPELSQRILAPKLDAIRAGGASVVTTGNPGCLMHIGAGLVRRGIPAETRHPVELLDDAYRAQGGSA
ncbi:MAG: heterodisulfide reductase-related iron-sulfur binding cluster [Gemmatimonadota bacterium]|nr:heterodisulfide reductase-related iron-sulfur binding cluster [Gemmatimonadota bacterium]